MLKIYRATLICILLLLSIFLSACQSTDSKQSSNSKNITTKPAEQLSKLEIARNDVVKKFKNERDVLGTSKFIEDTYKKYSDDKIISTIYFYNTSKFCRGAHTRNNSQEWLDNAKSFASKISPDYDGPFKEEILSYVSDFLGAEWDIQRRQALEQEKRFKSLSMEDKKAIKKYIQSRYDYYDSLKGKYTGDTYSDIIWEEASKKFGLSLSMITNIWSDVDVMKSIGEDK